MSLQLHWYQYVGLIGVALCLLAFLGLQAGRCSLTCLGHRPAVQAGYQVVPEGQAACFTSFCHKVSSTAGREAPQNSPVFAVCPRSPDGLPLLQLLVPFSRAIRRNGGINAARNLCPPAT